MGGRGGYTAAAGDKYADNLCGFTRPAGAVEANLRRLVHGRVIPSVDLCFVYTRILRFRNGISSTWSLAIARSLGYVRFYCSHDF